MASTGEVQRPAKRQKYDQDFETTITVLVGKQEKLFSIHKDAVCMKSKFFAAACSTRWRSGQERVVRLPEELPAIFQQYCSWIYAECINVTCTETSGVSERMWDRYMLIELYLLGDTLDDIALRNRTMGLLVERCPIHGISPGPQTLNRIWERTPQDSRLRKMIIDSFVARWVPAYGNWLNDAHPDMVRELALASLGKLPRSSAVLFSKRSAEYLESEDLDGTGV